MGQYKTGSLINDDTGVIDNAQYYPNTTVLLGKAFPLGLGDSKGL